MTTSEGVDRLVRPGFGRRVAIAVIAAMALALVLQVVTADGPDGVSGGVGGDYASFYAAGEIVLAEPGLDAERFYDPRTQFDAQERLLPSDSAGNLYFAYPAFFVAPYGLLAAIGFGWSYLIHTLLMAGALAGALALLRPMSRVGRERPVETYAAALTFFPLFRGVTGGQNTALTVLLVAAMWRFLHDGRELPAGIAAALLLFKPPLALPFLGALLLGRRFRAAGVAVATALALHLLGAALTDTAWLSSWADAVRYLDRVDTPFNVRNFVSVPGAAEAVLGLDSAAATVIGIGLATVAVLIVSWAWIRGVGDVGSRVALTSAGALVISPHALYYDAGLLIVVAIVLVDRWPELRRWLPVAWLTGLAHFAAEPLGVSPLVLLVVLAFGLCWRLVFSVPSKARAATSDVV